MMKPFDEIKAKLREISREHGDRAYELIIVIAAAAEEHYLDLLVEHSVGSKGTKTGKLDALEVLCMCLSVCNGVGIAPPDSLVHALETCTGVTERRQRKWEAQRKHYEQIITLFDYRQTNPKASQNQTAKDTGVPRPTVHRIENSAEWKKFVDDTSELERIRLNFKKNRGPLQTVYVAPTKDRADIFDEVREVYDRLLKSRIGD